MHRSHPTPVLRHAVILCHPDPHSFNHAIADAYCGAVAANGQETILRDLYAMRFDPVLKAQERPTIENFTVSADVQAELDVLRGCQAFVLIYPIWFGTPPAMLKGYVERVLGSGVNPRDVQARLPTSFLAGQRLVSFTTSAASQPWLSEQGQWQALRYVFDHYLSHAFGMQRDEHVHFASVVPGMEQRWADQHLYQVEQQARATCAAILAERYHPRDEQAVPFRPLA
ncbi:NAD(P)H-dependent oxidoreductase [Sphingomonas sp.]|uniref:NAD(P)H-dependent oxidoreductase n=1 Tax=Sphingomonas sp. TaxID=28214 RepID=UPI003B3AF0C5